MVRRRVVCLRVRIRRKSLIRVRLCFSARLLGKFLYHFQKDEPMTGIFFFVTDQVHIFGFG
jgi:hypothetical protein